MTQTTQQSHLLRLWYKPGSSMQGLIAQGQGQRLALVVAACFGAIQLLPWLSAEPSRPWWVLPLAAGLAIAGVSWLAWLLRNFGRWFGAAAHLHELRTALGVALLPWTLVFSLLFVLTQTAPAAESVQAWFPWFLAGFVYGFVILLLSLRAVLQVSALKTFLCLAIALAVSIFPFTLLAQGLVQALH